MEEIELKNSLSPYDVKETIGAFKNPEGTSGKRLRNFGIIEEADSTQVVFHRGVNNFSSQLKPVLVFSGKDDEGDFTKVSAAISKDDFLELAYNIRVENPETYQKVSDAFKGSTLEITKSDELYFAAEYVRRNSDQIIEGINDKISELHEENPQITEQLQNPDGTSKSSEELEELLKNPEIAEFAKNISNAMLETARFSSVELLTEISKKIALNEPHEEITKNEEAIINKMVNKDFINAMTSDTNFAKEAIALIAAISKEGEQLKETEELRANLADQFKVKTGRSLDL